MGVSSKQSEEHSPDISIRLGGPTSSVSPTKGKVPEVLLCLPLTTEDFLTLHRFSREVVVDVEGSLHHPQTHIKPNLNLFSGYYCIELNLFSDLNGESVKSHCHPYFFDEEPYQSNIELLQTSV